MGQIKAGVDKPREIMFAIVCKLIESSQKRCVRLKGFDLIGEVIEGIIFNDGIRTTDRSEENVS
jgi:hypothetical protein